MPKREDIKQLLERYAAGQASPQEQARLHGWFNRSAEHEAVGLDERGRYLKLSKVHS